MDIYVTSLNSHGDIVNLKPDDTNEPIAQKIVPVVNEKIVLEMNASDVAQIINFFKDITTYNASTLTCDERTIGFQIKSGDKAFSTSLDMFLILNKLRTAFLGSSLEESVAKKLIKE